MTKNQKHLRWLSALVSTEAQVCLMWLCVVGELLCLERQWETVDAADDARAWLKELAHKLRRIEAQAPDLPLVDADE